MSTREIKTIGVNGVKYSFIEYTTIKGLTYPSTTCIKVSIPNNYEDMFESIGGYTRDIMLRPLEETYQGADKMIILTTVKNGGKLHIHFIFEKEGDILGYITSIEPTFLPHVIGILQEHKDIVGECTIENSLEYIGDATYGGYLENYEEPTDLNLTGLMYKGENILAGEKFIIKGLTQHTDKLGGTFKQHIEDFKIDEMEVHVWDKVGAYTMVSDEFLIKPDGKVLTIWDDIVMYNAKKNTLTEEEIFASELDDELSSVHKRIERHKTQLVNQGLTGDELADGVEEFKKRVGYDRRVAEATKVVEELKKDAYTEIFRREELNIIMSWDGIAITKK